MEEGCLTRAVLLLKQLSESKQELQPAARGFAECHLICIQHNDADGFLWSVKLLQGVINHFPKQDLDPENLSAFLQDCFACAAAEREESPQALSAFHVATRHSDESLFRSCLAGSRSDLLRYHAASGLGSILQQRDVDESRREALRCFQISSSIADESLDLDYKAMASYQITTTLAQLGEESSLALEIPIGCVISSALVNLVNAEMKRKKDRPREEVIALYAEARRTLAKFQVNLENKLAETLGSSCCTTLFLLDYLRYDSFTKFSILLLPSRPDSLAIPLNVCFAAYDLYREARCEIIKLQEGWNGAGDARSYIEQGVEDMFLVSDQDTGVKSLVLGHQIAARTGDLDSIHWAGIFLDEYQKRRHRLGMITVPDPLSLLIACFEKHSGGNEDAEAWAYYYAGRANVVLGEVSQEQQYGFLEKCLKQAKSPILSCFAALALGNACNQDEKTGREYMQKAKNYVLESGNEELITDTMLQLFNTLIQNQMFQKAHEIKQELKHVKSKFELTRSVLSQGVVAFMEGYLKLAWGETAGALVHFEESFRLLEPLQMPDPAALKTYLSSSKDALSFHGRTTVSHCIYIASLMVTYKSSIRE